MFAAETAEFVHLKSVGVILLVFLRFIVSLLALCAHESNLDSCIISHFFGTSHLNFFDLEGQCTSL